MGVLFWDRLPIATACASAISADATYVFIACRFLETSWRELMVALLLAYLSVWWW